MMDWDTYFGLFLFFLAGVSVGIFVHKYLLWDL
jgi:hypothetical protein